MTSKTEISETSKLFQNSVELKKSWRLEMHR